MFAYHGGIVETPSVGDHPPGSPGARAAEIPPRRPPRLFEVAGQRANPRVEWVEIKVKSVLNRVQGMPFKWSINPYRGCAHACVYCYARMTHWYLDQDGVKDWSSRIFVKVNAPEVLRRELRRPTWQHEQVHLGTATDPYQPAEGTYRVTRQILEALRDYKTPAALVTKSTMVVRDRDVLQQLAKGPGAMVLFSITTVDSKIAREVEPDVPSPQKRLEALRALVEAGIPVGVLLAPVLPGITDDEDLLAAVIEAAKAHGASSLYTNTLHLGDVTRQAFFEYLEHKRPELVSAYARLYRGKYAPRAYQQKVKEIVTAIKARAQFAPGIRVDGRPAASAAQCTVSPVQTRLL